MSNSNLVSTQIPAHVNNYTNGRSGRKISMITIHHMAGVLSAKRCGELFQNGNRQASSHYGIGRDGEIGQYVSEENTAWTNTNWDANCKSVTIETSNSSINGDWPVSDVTLDSLIKLVADIAQRNNLGKLVKGQNLTWHSMYVKTNCPGPYLSSKLDYIIDEANKINGWGNIVIVEDKKSNEQIANEVIAQKWGNGQERKDRLSNAGYDYNAIQNIVNNKLLGTNIPNLKSIDEIAREVIAQKWGNGQERKDRLSNAGYNYTQVQNKVNQLLQ